VAFVCGKGKETYDDVTFAGSFNVEWGDFFSTGRLPRAKWGAVLVKHAWRLEAG
jgi:hypothetical protein